MTHPNLLHRSRSCAKWRAGVLLVAVLALSTFGWSVSHAGVVGGAFASPGNAARGVRPLNRPTIPVAPTNLKVKGPVLMLPGDSLTYVLTWGAASRATGYKVTLSSSLTNGTWTATGFGTGALALPVSVGPATGLSFTFTTISTTADSAMFTATVESADALGPTGKTASVSWKVKRRAGAPGPIIVDSSRAVGTLVLPNPVTLGVGGSRILCAFKVFTTGAVAAWTADRLACDSIYQAYVPAAMRVVTPAQQAHTDSMGVTCVTWNSSTVAVTVLPNGTCSSAARVTGVGLTYRTTDPHVLEAVGRLAIGPEWMGLPITALW